MRRWTLGSSREDRTTENMHFIEHWDKRGKIQVVESRGGVLATVDALANVVRASVAPWPTPELIQKLYGSHKWKGKTQEDDVEARKSLGHYCDLQSLSSEDAITWSFFGPLIYGPVHWREEFTRELFRSVDLPEPGSVAIWLWRRIPHPEKVETQGGPEIDFGVLSDDTLLLGEAKWNSPLGSGQGVAGDRTQLDLRRAYCVGLGRLDLPRIRHWCVLGVGRKADILKSADTGDTKIANLSWQNLASMMPERLAEELQQYLAWKERHSGP